MNIVLRSQVALGATALALVSAGVTNPVAAQQARTIPLLSTGQLALASFANPLTELLSTLGVVNSDVVGTGTYTAPYATYTGIIPQLIKDSLPIISQLGYNGSDYINNSVEQLFTGPTSTAVTLSNAAWAFVPDVINDGLGPAVKTLAGQINAAGKTAMAAGSYVLTGVATHLYQTLTSAVFYVTPKFFFATVGAVTAIARAISTVTFQFLEAAGTLNPEAAWNVAVKGLLGPKGADGKVSSSIPGTLEAVTIGNGLGVYDTPDYVPSFRTAIEGSIYALANNLGGDYPREEVHATAATPAAATPVAATPVAASQAAPVTSTVTPAAAASEAQPAAAPSVADNSVATPPASVADVAPVRTPRARTTDASRASVDPAGAQPARGRAAAAAKSAPSAAASDAAPAHKSRR